MLMEEEENTIVIHLPQDLITQILVRLPVKSLCRFKCVCRSWLSLISQPNFAVSHFEHSPPLLLYLPVTLHASQSLSIDLSYSLLNLSPLAQRNLRPNFLSSASVISGIHGSCRGFLLLDQSAYHNLWLWNPSTHFHKPLPRSDNITKYYRPSFYGFGYDSSQDDYLVLRFSMRTDGSAVLGGYNYTYCFEFFSLRANSWNQFDSTHLPYRNSLEYPKTGTLLNGIIHWLAFRYDDVQAYVILAFDLTERSFSEVCLPINFNSDLKNCNLCLLGGFLALYVVGSRTTDIWIMKKYKVQSSWSKSVVVVIEDLENAFYGSERRPIVMAYHNTNFFFSPICSTKGGDIVGLDFSTRVVKCDAEGHVIEHCSYSNDPYGCKAAMYRESLFSLPHVAADGGQAAEEDRLNDEIGGGH